jgi:hypothetical protein
VLETKRQKCKVGGDKMDLQIIEEQLNTRGVTFNHVDVILTSVARKVTNLISYLDFIQTEKVTDANDEKNILQQYEFMIDIAFVDDFGF